MTRICRAKNNFLIAFKRRFTRIRFHGLTSCSRRVTSPLFRFAFPYIWLAFREAHSSPWNVESVYCQAEEFKSKQISFLRYHSRFLPLSGTRNLPWPMDYMGWKLALEGWKVQYFVFLRIWFGFSFFILWIVLPIPLHLLLILISGSLGYQAESSLSITQQRFLIPSTLFQHLKLNWFWKLWKEINVKL